MQQFTKDGNFLKRVRNASPSGDMHSTTWMFALTRRRYCEKMLIFVGWIRLRAHSGLHALVIASKSSATNIKVDITSQGINEEQDILPPYKLGTSPEFNIPLISSSIVSFII